MEEKVATQPTGQPLEGDNKEKPNILFLKASKDICTDEMGSLNHYANLIGLTVRTEEIHSEESLEYIVRKYKTEEVKFDYIYLCTHGRKEGFMADLGDKKITIYWSTFAQLFCEKDILNEDTIFMLACCQGGLFQVATDVMAVCNSINYVCGVKWSVQNWDLTTGFIVFLHNLINKNAEPSYAAQKASLATDYTFVCNDRDEIESMPQFINRQQDLYREIGWIDEDGNTITDDAQILANTNLAPPVTQ